MIPSALQNTFEVLSKASSAAAVPVLEQALRCRIPNIRLEAARVLVRRGGADEMQAIVRCLDQCSQEDLSFLSTCSGLLCSPVEFAIESEDFATRHQGLIAVARLRLSTLLHHIVQAAENVEDELQILAIELLSELANRAGTAARTWLNPAQKELPSGSRIAEICLTGIDSTVESQEEHFRAHLLLLLRSSIAKFDSHRVRAILDAWISACHWEDPAFQSLFSPFPDPVAPVAIRRLRQLKNGGIDDLLVGTYWSSTCCVRYLELLAERPPVQVLKAFLDKAQCFGITTIAARNLVEFPVPVLGHITEETLRDLPSINVVAWFRLLANSQASPDLILQGICVLSQRIKSNSPLAPPPPEAGEASPPLPIEWDAELQSACLDALTSLQPLNPSVVSLALSEGLTKAPDLTPYEAPPWKTGLRRGIDRLLEAIVVPDSFPEKIRDAIERLFQDFTAAQLVQTIENWPTDHTIAFARVTRVFDSPFPKNLEHEAKNPSPARRKNTHKLLQLLEPEDWAIEIAYIGLNDALQDVRIEAIRAFARSPDKIAVQQCLSRLLQDNSTEVADIVAEILDQLPTD